MLHFYSSYLFGFVHFASRPVCWTFTVGKNLDGDPGAIAPILTYRHHCVCYEGNNPA